MELKEQVKRNMQEGMKEYVKEELIGKDGKRGSKLKMRWIGDEVGEMKRIMKRGGMFLYVKERRKGYEKGRMRMV